MTNDQHKAIEDVIYEYLKAKQSHGIGASNTCMETLIDEFPDATKKAKQRLKK